MGLFSKLKNVLFEEEEIEVPVEEPRKKITKEVTSRPIKQDKQAVKMSFESEEEPLSPVNDRELFKAEKTFDFPVFDDQEFENMKEKPAKPIEEERPKSMSINLFDHEKPKNLSSKNYEKPKPEAKEIKGRAYTKQRKEPENTKFRPSPVISPVYGVLDKNYKKEDIITKKDEPKPIDVESVRKKAFGTLEEDLEKTLSKSREVFYGKPKEIEQSKEKKPSHIEQPTKENEKSIEDLLEETAFDSINIHEEEQYNNDNKHIDFSNEEKLTKPKEKTREEKLEEDTIENDLFELIDSMYENREDE